MSVGQVVGGVIGGVIGFFAGGNVMLGASIGMSIGGYIDPPKGQDIVGPRLEDLTVQTSTYGAILPRVKGTVGITGNVFWLEGDKIKEHKKTKKVGGKGGGGTKQTTYSYSATFAVGLSHQIAEPITAIRRMWIGNKLVFEASSGNIESIIASAANMVLPTAKNSTAEAAYINQPSYAVYYGTDDQQPDPRMQADKGIANVSGYPGRCYIVFYDLDLTEHYNNTLMAAQVKVEIVCSGTPTIQHNLISTSPGSSELLPRSAVADSTSVRFAIMRRSSWDGTFYGADFYETRLGEYNNRLVASVDRYIDGSAYLVTGVYTTTVCQSSDGPSIFASRWHYGVGAEWLEYVLITKAGVIVDTTVDLSAPFDQNFYICAIDGAEIFTASDQSARPIQKISGSICTQYTGGSLRINSIGFSEQYIFALNYTTSTTSCTVTVINRADMTHVATYTQSVSGLNGTIHVISDSEFYTSSGSDLFWWRSGVATAIGAVLHTPVGNYPERWFWVSQNPYYAVQFDSATGSYAFDVVVSNAALSASAAKLHDIVTEECALAGISSADLDLTELVNSDVLGYRASSAGSVRTVLEQLQAAFPFDVVQSGYKLKFKSRGGASVITVQEDDLGAHTGDEVPSRFMLTTEMPSQVPAKVTFNFLNADREYDPDEQSATFTAQDVKNSYTVSLPIVMTPTEALRAADVLLRKEQVERTSAGTFWLPPTDAYRKLEAADVIDVIAQGRTHTLRLTKVTQLPDGRVECDGKLTSSSAYTSTALAQSPLVLGPTTVALPGSSELVLLDIPRLLSDQDAPGISLGMYGYTSGWPGGIAMRSDDNGESFTAVVSFDEKLEVFTVAGTPATVFPYSVDHITRLTVTPSWTGADLFSISDTQFYGLGNIAAYGADGRWEIVAFKTVVDNGNGTYTLSDFLRGRYGTEWAMTLHAAGDQLVMLDPDLNDFAALPTGAINAMRLWRGVTSGAAIDSADDVQSTYAAVNLKPLSPVDFRGKRDSSTNDWVIYGTRRSRWPVEVFSGSVTPLAETAEQYELDVYDATFTTFKRTISASGSLEFSYSSANQVSDFGEIQTDVHGKAYQISSVIGRGYPAQFTASYAYANPSDYAVWGSHFDGTNGSTSITEVTGQIGTCVGNAKLSTARYVFGTASLLLDGTGDYVTYPHLSKHNLTSVNFTIRGRIWIVALSGGTMEIVNKDGVSGSSYSQYSVAVNSTGKLFCFLGNGNGTSPTGTSYTGTTTITTGAWHSFELSVFGTSVKGFVDGVTQFTGTKPAMYAGSKPLLIGYQTGQPASAYFNGYIDDLSILSGIAEHTADYTPSTLPF